MLVQTITCSVCLPENLPVGFFSGCASSHGPITPINVAPKGAVKTIARTATVTT